MPEGLSPQEVSREIGEHAKHSGESDPHAHRDRIVSILEAILLSIVALTAAWSGYAAAQWSTESRVGLAEASSARTKASHADLEAVELRNFDSSTFEAWFTAYSVGNKQAMALAEHRFRPQFHVAFAAWRATKPETNPDAPRGPTFMPQYRQPGVAKGKALETKADEAFASGQSAGEISDKFIRVTVYLASVLFLVGISTRFPLRGGRYALIGLGAAMLVLSFVQLTQLPGPPT
ncbi:MAG TPA: hypothetical protein VGN84_00310 [Solirubrobacterales bacterium]|jgi:hypothetical protein|nr:hypothetical protein [Solirubrobacterales bacterium]